MHEKATCAHTIRLFPWLVVSSAPTLVPDIVISAWSFSSSNFSPPLWAYALLFPTLALQVRKSKHYFPLNLVLIGSKGLAHAIPSSGGTLWIYFTKSNQPLRTHLLQHRPAHPLLMSPFRASAEEARTEVTPPSISGIQHEGEAAMGRGAGVHFLAPGSSTHSPDVTWTSHLFPLSLTYFKMKGISPLHHNLRLLGKIFCEEVINLQVALFTQSVVIKKSCIISFSLYLSFLSTRLKVLFGQGLCHSPLCMCWVICPVTRM